jgi:osmotically-inducible protein OsmY
MKLIILKMLFEGAWGFIMMKKTVSKAAPLLILALTVLTQTGCVGLAVGAGATVGVAAAQEGGIPVAVNDVGIRAQITDLWFKENVDMYRALSMTVKEGRVLITGVLPDPDQRVTAVRLAWQAQGVKEVINEIKIDKSEGIPGFVRDSWITSTIKTKLTFDRYVSSINYNVETVGGVVYLMGIAQDQVELNRALDHARNTQYVRNVVSYVRLRGQNPRPVNNAPVSHQSNVNTQTSPMPMGGGTLTPEDLQMPPAGQGISSPASVQSEALPPLNR